MALTAKEAEFIIKLRNEGVPKEEAARRLQAARNAMGAKEESPLKTIESLNERILPGVGAGGVPSQLTKQGLGIDARARVGRGDSFFENLILGAPGRAIEGFKSGFNASSESSRSAEEQLRKSNLLGGFTQQAMADLQTVTLPFIRAAFEVVDPAISPVIEGVGEKVDEAGKAIGSELSKLLPESVGPAVRETLFSAAEEIKNLTPETKDLFLNIFRTLEVASSIPWAKLPVKQTFKIITQRGGGILDDIAVAAEKKFPSLFESFKPAKTIDDVVAQAEESIAKGAVKDGVVVADEGMKKTALKTGEIAKKQKTPAQIREVAETKAPGLTLSEKFTGVSEDIKKRIQGKPEQLKEYFDISHARNLDDTLPTPLDYGAQKVEKARDLLNSELSSTGSKIGQFREKVKTVQVGIDDVEKIENTFNEALRPLNLALDEEGTVTRLKGRISGKVSDSEINVLNRLKSDLDIVKQSPNLENLIDLRNSFDNVVNFAKQSKEASGVVDPLSRKVRAVIKEVNSKAIGREQAALLDQYSNMIGLLEELNTFVDSRSGGEFLLKRVLSERGRIPREILAQLKEITGIDLMDDATMAQIAIEVIGNDRQKGLFRQEIEKAGLDIMDVLGGKAGAVKALLKKWADAALDSEKVFLEAAGQPKTGVTKILEKISPGKEPTSFKSAGPAVSATPDDFKKISMKAQTPDRSLTEYSAEELSKFDTRMFSDKKAGYALKPIQNDGSIELVNVFSLEKGRGGLAVEDALLNSKQKGAKKIILDSYKRLEGFYERYGFRTKKTLKFDPKIAGFEGGEDVVIMEINL